MRTQSSTLFIIQTFSIYYYNVYLYEVERKEPMYSMNYSILYYDGHDFDEKYIQKLMFVYSLPTYNKIYYYIIQLARRH